MRISRSILLALAFLGVQASSAVEAPPRLKWESAAEKAKVDRKLKQVDSVIRKGPCKADWASLQGHEAPDWWRDAKFGIFIHWGLYSVPAYANEWYSRNMYQQGDDAFKHHAAVYGPQSKFGYKDFIPLFKAEKFDPSHWASLFKEAGAKYVIPVAEHHDGFAMYDSDLSRWTAAKKGPRKDLLGLLAKAVRKEGLVFGTSSHRAEHWWFMSGGMQFDSDVRDQRYADFYGPAVGDDSAPDEAYLRDWLARSCELVDKYRPKVLYFDWWVGEKPVFKPYLAKFAAYFYDRAAQRGEKVVLNTKDKAFVPGTSVQDVEKGKLPGINPSPWQTDTSVSWKSWAYLKEDSLKGSGYLIRSLIDTVSRNGNLLLDIGPRADGTIPEEQERVLREIGGWLKVHGEAVYGTRPWVLFGEGPTKDGLGKFSEADTSYREGDLRFTRKGNFLYVLTMTHPSKEVKVLSLGRGAAPGLTVKEVSLLGSGERVRWSRGSDGLILSAPSSPGDMPVVYKVELEGALLGDLGIRTTDPGFLASAVLQNYGGQEASLEVALSVDGKGAGSKTVTLAPLSEARVEIPYEAPKPGLYRLALSSKGQKALEGRATFPSMDLSGEWLFKEGDDPSWSKPDLDDSLWQKVRLPDSWESHSHYTQDNVYGWYRKRVLVPAEWKGHDIVLPLGKIDDADLSFLNGKEIGRTGSFPPKFEGHWDQPRWYRVPAGAVHFGSENVIAIKVFDAYGGGGLYDGPLGPIEVKYAIGSF